MKSIIDQEMVNRRARLANGASLGGMFLLMICVVFSLYVQNQGTLSALLLFAGFASSVVGIFLANRWVKKPRPEEALKETLKSLADSYQLYHYLSPARHLLLTPGGLVVLETLNLDGVFIYKNDRWKQKYSASRALRIIFEERLGDPIRRTQSLSEAVKARIEPRLPPGCQVPVIPLVVFVHPLVHLEVEAPAVPVCTPKTLLKKIPTHLPRLDPAVYQQLARILDQAAASPGRAL